MQVPCKKCAFKNKKHKTKISWQQISKAHPWFVVKTIAIVSVLKNKLLSRFFAYFG